MKKRFVILLTMISILLFVDKVNAQTIEVCNSGDCTYSTIKEAYESSAAGDTIKVKKGIYEEDLININQEITIEGEDNVVIKQKNVDGIFVVENIDATVKFSNLTITSVTEGENKKPFFIDDVHEIILTNITISDLKGGVSINRVEYAKIDHLNTSNINSSALFVRVCGNVEITESKIINSGSTIETPSILLNDCRSGTINNIIVEDAKAGSILFSSVEEISMSNSTIKNSNDGVNIVSVENANISGLNVSGIAQNAISVKDSNVKITNLIASNITNSAVYAKESEVVMNGGTITNAGIRIDENNKFASISLNDETETSINGVTLKEGNFEAIGINNTTKPVNLNNIKIINSNKGIYVNSSSNVKITNLTASNLEQNAIIMNKSKAEINGGTITNAGIQNGESGYESLGLYNDNELIIKALKIKDSKFGAIGVYNTTKPINIEDVEIVDSKKGIYLDSSSNVKITNLTASNVTISAIYSKNSKMELSGGTLTNVGNILENGNGYSSINITEESESTINNITIKKSLFRAIRIDNTTKPINIKDVEIVDSKVGIYVNSSSDVKITNLTASNITNNAIYSKNSKMELSGGTIINAGLKQEKNGLSSISLNDETEAKISDLIIKDAKYEGLGVNNTTKPVNIKGVTIYDSNSGVYVGNATLQAEDLYIVNSVDYAIKTKKGKIILKNTNEFNDDKYEFLGYSEEKKCSSYINDSDYSSEQDISLYSCSKKDIIENKGDDVDNPKTGGFNVFIIILFSMITIGGAIYYFKRIKKNSVENLD